MQVILKKEGYVVQIAESGTDALNVIKNNYYDIILLDLGLPDLDGIEVLKIIRNQTDSPIIIISARNTELSKVEALDLGADDYITKPFGTKELLARIRTSLRHHKNNALETVIDDNGLKIDFEKRLVFKNNQEIHLTNNEFKILYYLFQNIGKAVTYQQLLKAVWGVYLGDEKTLRVNISNIRKKIEDTPLEPKYLLTEIGVGYRLKDWRT